MNKLTIAIAAAALSVTTFVSVAPAAESDRASKMEERIDRRVERMSQNLGLDDAQRAQLTGVMREQAEKRRAVHEETRSRIAEFLTEEQSAKMEAAREHRQERRAEHRGKHGKHSKREHDRKDCEGASKASFLNQPSDRQAKAISI